MYEMHGCDILNEMLCSGSLKTKTNNTHKSKKIIMIKN